MKDNYICAFCGKEVEENNRKEALRCISRQENKRGYLCNECGEEVKRFIGTMLERSKK